MKIFGPDRYHLAFDAGSFSVRCPKGTPRFSGIATTSKPKLYIISVRGWPIYVGITKQSIRNRLRFGWSADGAHGYHGYAFRRKLSAAVLDIWCHEDAPNENPCLDMETIEAEVVFLIREAGQWPKYQTEIHFHPSTEAHRKVARDIMSRFSARCAPTGQGLDTDE